MTNVTDAKIIPLDPRERNLWVIFQLRLRGKTLKKIADGLGISLGALRNALYQPSLRAEEKLAEALDLTPEELFPERYDTDGKRLIEVRPKRGRPPNANDKAA